MGTSTSTFGVGKRESHDASDFYARFSPPEISNDDKLGEPGKLDTIHVGDSRNMSKIPDASVALVVTSPPYFAGKAYETALGEGHVPGDYIEYLQMLRDVFAECLRVLEPGGRMAINVANLGRRPYRSLAADVTTILQDDLRMLLRGEVIWQKQRGASGSCAWGSYQSPSNPVFRDTTERLIVASKGRFDRVGTGTDGTATVPGDEFMEATLDVWELPAESATRVGHPAPFPVSLVERCLHLLTYEGDVVLDPFMGSGTTAVAAKKTGRHFVGYDTDRAYVKVAKERVKSMAPAKLPDRRTMKELARAALEAAGWEIVAEQSSSGTWRDRERPRRPGRARTTFRIRGCQHACPRRHESDRNGLEDDREGVDPAREQQCSSRGSGFAGCAHSWLGSRWSARRCHRARQADLGPHRRHRRRCHRAARCPWRGVEGAVCGCVDLLP